MCKRARYNESGVCTSRVTHPLPTAPTTSCATDTPTPLHFVRVVKRRISCGGGFSLELPVNTRFQCSESRGRGGGCVGGAADTNAAVGGHVATSIPRSRRRRRGRFGLRQRSLARHPANGVTSCTSHANVGRVSTATAMSILRDLGLSVPEFLKAAADDVEAVANECGGGGGGDVHSPLIDGVDMDGVPTLNGVDRGVVSNSSSNQSCNLMPASDTSTPTPAPAPASSHVTQYMTAASCAPTPAHSSTINTTDVVIDVPRTM